MFRVFLKVGTSDWLHIAYLECFSCPWRFTEESIHIWQFVGLEITGPYLHRFLIYKITLRVLLLDSYFCIENWSSVLSYIHLTYLVIFTLRRGEYMNGVVRVCVRGKEYVTTPFCMGKPYLCFWAIYFHKYFLSVGFFQTFSYFHTSVSEQHIFTNDQWSSLINGIQWSFNTTA